MDPTVIAVDLAKSVFQVVVSRRPGKVSESHRLSRSKFLAFFGPRQPALVLMEACGTAHYWARQLRALGHRVLLLPPHHVRAYVRRNKTDFADPKALLEAHRHEQIHAVPAKSVAQQTLTALHCLRSTWVSCRTARLNLVRGILRELGFPIPVGAEQVVPRAWSLLEDPAADLPMPLRQPLANACLEIRDCEARIGAVDKQLKALAAELPIAKRLVSIPGAGLITATALVGFVGGVHRFPTSRHFASSLGLAPREHSSGLRRHLGRISKHGDTYLRMLLITGARAALIAASKRPPDRLRIWALHVEMLRGHNRAAIALANKLARIVWAVWRTESSFESRPLAA
ncbi:MAG TPA: IS110 family transposase [Thermoanaerobaculia bacterium]|jgi:transposase|nr:IS110 family transposase [Thermoanaerobaculia bacterium]